MSDQSSSRETIHWLDVAVAAQRGAVAAAIHPVDVLTDAPNFAVTINDRWIVGGDGKLSVFETPQVARRFLELLCISRVHWKGEGEPPDLPAQCNFTRFYLSRCRLMENSTEVVC